MALIPTVIVTTAVRDQSGDPVSGAVVEARLTTVDRWQGYIVPELYRGITDAEGLCRLPLFPNELGSENSQYTVTVKLPDESTAFSALAYVPNHDCFLHDISEITPPEAKRDSTYVVTGEVAAYAKSSADAAEAAKKSAQDAAESAALAADLLDSTQYQTESAQGWAESETSPGVEGTKSARRWALELTERGNHAVFRILHAMRHGLEIIETRWKELSDGVEARIQALIDAARDQLQALIDPTVAAAEKAQQNAETATAEANRACTCSEAAMQSEIEASVQAELAKNATTEADQARNDAVMAKNAAIANSERAGDYAKKAGDCMAGAEAALSEVNKQAAVVEQRYSENLQISEEVAYNAQLASERAEAAAEFQAQASQAADNAAASETSAQYYADTAKQYADEIQSHIDSAAESASAAQEAAERAEAAAEIASEVSDDIDYVVETASSAMRTLSEHITSSSRQCWVAETALAAESVVEVPWHSSGDLFVFVDGMLLYPELEYIDTDITHITLKKGIAKGSYITVAVLPVSAFVMGQGLNSASYVLFDNYSTFTNPELSFGNSDTTVAESDIIFVRS